jgi:hypothetical protein
MIRFINTFFHHHYQLQELTINDCLRLAPSFDLVLYHLHGLKADP